MLFWFVITNLELSNTNKGINEVCLNPENTYFAQNNSKKQPLGGVLKKILLFCIFVLSFRSKAQNIERVGFLSHVDN